MVIGFGPKAQEMDNTLRVIAGPEGDVIKENHVQELQSRIQEIKTAACSSTFTSMKYRKLSIGLLFQFILIFDLFPLRLT